MPCLPAHGKSWALIHSLPLEVVQRGLGKKHVLIISYILLTQKVLNTKLIFLVILQELFGHRSSKTTENIRANIKCSVEQKGWKHYIWLHNLFACLTHYHLCTRKHGRPRIMWLRGIQKDLMKVNLCWCEAKWIPQDLLVGGNNGNPFPPMGQRGLLNSLCSSFYSFTALM